MGRFPPQRSGHAITPRSKSHKSRCTHVNHSRSTRGYNCLTTGNDVSMSLAQSKLSKDHKDPFVWSVK
ncbi:hypothetical protein Smp_145100 [Schistosoma mansoni]|uniref:hypothetical protein n=1 Tax=Schistosoma mansoni TaxID=6183 RepID=UPI0001A63C07|nr:hypothetical protein Smp_145100 [Schistosoma mansoni]|eukprot:XP_018647087.1 hypothetical protein Smp_145100 [Schistosoma mansoni]